MAPAPMGQVVCPHTEPPGNSETILVLSELNSDTPSIGHLGTAKGPETTPSVKRTCDPAGSLSRMERPLLILLPPQQESPYLKKMCVS